eukprot:CAMPEP_0175175138 /NCGR_PEP_ID=MMETSP0087-20121206/33037_1 /TAXON_ID=136419 /ORGANISM="Unknown Unknown, Strain D1" /LENGTH=356 /DNA_ID=CAMNT_0016466717 /DNA_START=27 /DNA_END=1098 /DNA_ORIENTATION=-
MTVSLSQEWLAGRQTAQITPDSMSQFKDFMITYNKTYDAHDDCFSEPRMARWSSNSPDTPDSMSQFKDFMITYNKTYDAHEYAYRAGVFANNLLIAEKNNREDPTATFGVTKFMDLTTEEFKSRYLTYRPSNDTAPRVEPSPRQLADKIDWNAKGALTAIKDQGNCGSCWAFSATEAIESYAFLSGKYQLQELSPQQITSCDSTDAGCNGGDTPTAYNYVIKAGGIESESAYPYTSGRSGNTGKCKFNKSDIKVEITGHKKLAKSETALKSGLQDGPVSICLAADKFQTYNSGILSRCPGQVDHCVQATGYDDTYKTPYWIVRNSWAKDWGEDGFIRIEQGKNLCKIDSEITYPTF